MSDLGGFVGLKCNYQALEGAKIDKQNIFYVIMFTNNMKNENCSRFDSIMFTVIVLQYSIK